MKITTILAAGLVSAAAAGAATAATLVDGVYGCHIGTYFLGDIRIEGTTYAGPAFDGNYEGSYPFELVGGTINWGGPLGGITMAGKVVSTVLTDAGNDRAGFDITIQNNDSGNYQTVSCFPG